jgi:hypothetical protein
MSGDDRMTWGLIIDVLDVLERHGYHRHDDQHTGQAISVIGDLARVYQGTRDVPSGTYLDQAQPHPESARPVPEADQDAVVLTGADARTVVAALDLAADYKRDRAETCADCTDQSCLTCQFRLREAQSYDRMAAQLLRAPHAAKASQPEPHSPGQTDPGCDKEAGQ